MATARGASSGSARKCAASRTTSWSRVISVPRLAHDGTSRLRRVAAAAVGQLVVGRVADLLQRQPAGRRDRARRAAAPGRRAPAPASRRRAGPRRPRSRRRPASGPWCGRTRRRRPWRPAGRRPSRDQASSSRVRTVVAPSRRRQNAAKSCSPSSRVRGLVHRVDVQRAPVPQHVVPPQRLGPERVVADPVGVAPPQRREPGVEAGRGDADGADPDVGRQHAGEPRGPGRAASPSYADAGTSSVHHLPAGVHPGVGPAGAGRPAGAASRSTVARAPSSSACTVRRPGWTAQPAKSVPS